MTGGSRHRDGIHLEVARLHGRCSRPQPITYGTAKEQFPSSGNSDLRQDCTLDRHDAPKADSKQSTECEAPSDRSPVFTMTLSTVCIIGSQYTHQCQILFDGS